MLTSVPWSKAHSINTTSCLSTMPLPSARSSSTTTVFLCGISRRGPSADGAEDGDASTTGILCPKWSTVPRNRPMATSSTLIWVLLLVVTHWRSPSLPSLPKQTNIWLGFLTPNFRNSLYYLLRIHLHMDYSPQALFINDRKRPAGFSISVIPMELTKMGQMPGDLKCLFLPPANKQRPASLFRWRCLSDI